MSPEGTNANVTDPKKTDEEVGAQRGTYQFSVVFDLIFGLISSPRKILLTLSFVSLSLFSLSQMLSTFSNQPQPVLALKVKAYSSW